MVQSLFLVHGPHIKSSWRQCHLLLKPRSGKNPSNRSRGASAVSSAGPCRLLGMYVQKLCRGSRKSHLKYQKCPFLTRLQYPYTTNISANRLCQCFSPCSPFWGSGFLSFLCASIGLRNKHISQRLILGTPSTPMSAHMSPHMSPPAFRGPNRRVKRRWNRRWGNPCGFTRNATRQKMGEWKSMSMCFKNDNSTRIDFSPTAESMSGNSRNCI